MSQRNMVEIQENFHIWNQETEGRTIEGYLGPADEITVGDGDISIKRVILADDGQLIGFLSPRFSLEPKLKIAGEGTYIAITYVGEELMKSGNSLKKFKVWTDQPDATTN